MLSPSLTALLALLPPGVRREILRREESYLGFEGRLFEIRLRAGMPAALLFDGKNVLLPVPVSPADVENTFTALCGGSVYAHTETLREGYLTYGSFRVGVVGRAVREGGRITGLCDVSSLVLRIPHCVAGAGDVAEKTFLRLGGRRGLLIYAPPCGGKTTLLADLAVRLSRGREGRRVALIDTREELFDATAAADCQIDVLRGYPPDAGILLATRTLAPEVILCDEIASAADAAAVLAATGGGVPLIASAHAGSIGELFSRAALRPLLSSGCFGAYIGISREGGAYRYTVTDAEQVVEGEGVRCGSG